ncbi:MAG: putative monooxygenase [Caulobacteraceae bacterium]|nr:putative monooxygenase [Caulobacteraceae bacterium]
MNAVRTADTAGQPGRDDFATLEARYREEQARRLRPEGTAQYIGIDGRFAHMAEDPYIERPVVRDPLAEDVDVVIVGGGWSGLLAAVNLRKAGIDDFRVVETGGDFGGVWYWNRYPGAMCDVESYIYMPLLEELGYIPTQKYANAEEIRAHALRIGRHFNLYPNALFQTQVTRIEWNPDRSRWVVSTNRGDSLHARFVILGGGPLNHPKLPGVPGIEAFKGHAFHTSRWDYAYTGGDMSGGLTGLSDKRVAIIGTGATAMQAVPHLGEWAQKLYVVQRTPAIVDWRGNRPTDPAWAASLEPGWQRRRMENFDGLLSGKVSGEDLVGDAWTDIWAPPPFAEAIEAGLDPRAEARRFDFEKLERIRARVESIVKDPRTAESLKPYYYRFCKRPCFHDEYLPTFNRPNVELIDTRGRGLDRIEEQALVFDGRRYEVDCIVYATGFELNNYTNKAGGFQLIGRDGLTLDEAWAEHVRSLHGVYVRGFPNVFLIGNAKQGAPTINFPFMVDEQARHAASVVRRLLDEKIVAMEVSQAAEARWGRTIKEKSIFDREYVSACTPSFYNAEGKADDTAAFTTVFGGGPFEYIRLLEDWRETGLEQDVELKRED